MQEDGELTLQQLYHPNLPYGTGAGVGMEWGSAQWSSTLIWDGIGPCAPAAQWTWNSSSTSGSCSRRELLSPLQQFSSCSVFCEIRGPGWEGRHCYLAAMHAHSIGLLQHGAGGGENCLSPRVAESWRIIVLPRGSPPTEERREEGNSPPQGHTSFPLSGVPESCWLLFLTLL